MHGMRGTRGSYCCDMRGMLSFQILWLLSRKSMHGDEIAEEIAKRRGFKPAAGTIYPALKEMNERGLIKGQKKGKTIVYSLSAEGKEGIKHAVVYFCHSFGDIFESAS